jgi:hypothetical protein
VVEVKINGLAVDAHAKSHVVILKEKDGERRAPSGSAPPRQRQSPVIGGAAFSSAR